MFLQLLQSFFGAPNINVGTGILGPLQPLLFQFMTSTDQRLTYSNPVVLGVWTTMLAVADAALMLLIIVGTIQIMVSSSTGALSIPFSQFLPKIILTAIFVHLSSFFGSILIQFSNALCGVLNTHFNLLLRTVNNGDRITNGQSFLLQLGVILVLNFSLIRLLVQAFERLALWNLLFVVSPLALLCSMLPQMTPVAASWGRLFLVVTLTQFAQLLALTLGLALWTSTGLTGLPGSLLAIATLFLIARIPDALARFASLSFQGGGGAGQLLITTVLLGARLLAA
jgi:hypothetical protein